MSTETKIPVDQILIGGPIRKVLTPFRKRFSKGDPHRRWLKKTMSRRHRDRQWRIYSPLPLTIDRLISVLSVYEQGQDLPPILVRKVFVDGDFKYRIVDGRHRLTCHLAIGRTHIKAKPGGNPPTPRLIYFNHQN